MNKIILVFLATFFVGIAYGSHAPLVPVFAREEINATYIEIGTIGMLNYLPYMFIPALIGVLLDKFNRGVIMSIGIAISAVTIFTLSLSNSVIEVMIIRAFAGLAHAFLWPAAASIVTSETNNSVKYISRFTMFWVAGFMLGPLIGSFLFENLGFRLLFQYTTLFMIIALILSLIASINIQGSNKRYQFANVLMIIKSNTTIYMLIIYYSAVFGITLAVFPAYIKEHGINESQIGILFFIFGLARLLTLPFTHKLANRSMLSILIATLSISLSMLISYLLINFSLISLALIMLGFAFSVYFPLTLGMVTRGVSNDMLGKYVGVYETVFGIGWTIGPLAAGILANTFASNTPYLIMFIIGFILPILLRFNSK